MAPDAHDHAQALTSSAGVHPKLDLHSPTLAKESTYDRCHLGKGFGKKGKVEDPTVPQTPREATLSGSLLVWMEAIVREILYGL